MPKIAITAAFSKNRNEFLIWCNERKRIESAIIRLERKIACESAPLGHTRWIFFEDTHEEDVQYASLGCVVVINPLTSEHAPCWLFFPYQKFGEPLPKVKVARQIKLVMDELGWD